MHGELAVERQLEVADTFPLVLAGGAFKACPSLALRVEATTWIFFATSLAWPWYALVGSAITFTVGVVAERMIPSRR